MGCAHASHEKRPYRVHLVQRKLAGEVPVKLIECHVHSGRRCKGVDVNPCVESQGRTCSRPAKLDQRKIVKAKPGRHTVTDTVFQGCPGLRKSLRLNLEGPAKTTPNERGDLETLDFKLLCNRRRRSEEGGQHQRG